MAGVARAELRAPDNDNWEVIAVQSLISYPPEEAARRFFTESAQWWDRCTKHTVKITLNDGNCRSGRAVSSTEPTLARNADHQG
jgi:hypothetical protein